MLDADLWRDVEGGLRAFGPILHADTSRDGSIADMARRALEEAPAPFCVVGFSMGGYVAREIVRQAPDRVQALILIATSARGDTDVQLQRKAALAAQSPSTVFGGLSKPAVVSSLHPDRASDNELIARIQAMGARLGGEVFRRQSLLERHDERGSLGAIRCPTLVIAGAQDRLRSLDEARELNDGIAGSDLSVIDGTGHMIPMEKPEELVALIAAWLTRNGF
jgi:pimeloyl-ACP methyl ester carboxylesterase